MGPIGVQEMIAIFIIALLLFGPKKLPELGRMLGKALSEFRRAKSELKSTFESHLHELEREARFDDTGYSPKTDHSPARYTYPYEDYKYSSGELPYSDSQPSTALPSATPPAEPQTDIPARNTPVADTVPRNNGFQPVDPASVAHEQEHPV